MGMTKDVNSVFSDLTRWYKKINHVYHHSGLSNKVSNYKAKGIDKQNKLREKANKKYLALCQWMKNEMKK